MAEKIAKEVIIVLLLILAVILVLAVLLYDFFPMSKIIPSKISYTTPSNVSEELGTDSNIDDSQIVLTHQIDATDLTNYKRIQEYVPGRKNPFEDVITEPEEGEEGTSEGGEQASGGSSQANSQGSKTTTQSGTNSNSGSGSSNTGYLPDKGTK